MEKVLAAVLIDSRIMFKIRDGRGGNRPVYAAIGVDLAGRKDILGMWAGDGESAKFWLAMLTELRNRGMADVLAAVCDGPHGLPDSVNTVWPAAVAQTCITHLIRGSFRYASRTYWDELARDLKPIYTAPTVAAAETALDTLEDKWGQRYPAIIGLWRNAWNEFIGVPGLRRGDPKIHLLHQRHRRPQCPLLMRGHSTRALPQRASSYEMPLPGHQITGPERPDKPSGQCGGSQP